MQIILRKTIDMETGEVLELHTMEYDGPVKLACGATKAQKQAQAREASITGSMQADFEQIFGDNENILKSVTGALDPIVKAGPEQYGYAPKEDAAMRTQAMDVNAAAGRNATNAVRSSLASRGGGNIYLPTGSEAEIEGELAQSQAEKQADAQLAITQKGYDTGRQNFFESEGRLAAAPGELENPATSAGSAAMGAAEGSMKGATDIADANNAWIAPVAGMIGAVGGAAVTGGMKKG